MKRFLASLFFVFCASGYAQTTSITVTADTNRVIRTNFSLVRSQVSDLSGATYAISNITGLQTALDGKLATNGTLAISNITSLQSSLDSKLATNGSAAGLTNFPALVLQTNSAETNFPSFLLRTNGNASGLTFPPSLLTTNGSGAGLTNLTAANITGTVALASNVSGTVAIANGGTGATSASNARVNLLPSYTGNENRILALNSNATDVVWTTNTAGVASGSWWTNAPTSAVSFTTNTGSAGQVLALANATNLVWTNVASGGDTITNTNSAIRIPSTNNSATYTGADSNHPITIGINATNSSRSIVIGFAATTRSPVGHDQVIIGRGTAATPSSTVAIGVSSVAATGAGSVAIGNGAVVTNSGSAKGVQLGGGTLNSQFSDGAQFFDWGVVDSSEWGALAAATSVGQSIMKVTNAGTSNRFLISTVSDGSGVQWTTTTNVRTNLSIAAFFGTPGTNAVSATGTNAIQIGAGTNTNADTIQFVSSGTIDTNEWARLSAISTYPTINISVVGTNNTNTLVFSNGILVEVQ